MEFVQISVPYFRQLKKSELMKTIMDAEDTGLELTFLRDNRKLVLNYVNR